jgi:mannosyl-glycoprotein endo-beta-N-acetylglucosaminidase
LGLSVAIFGPAWSWESEQDKPGFTWESWWSYERSLWIGGVPLEDIKVPDMPKRREEEPDCPHGHFQPYSDFFTSYPPPDPSILPFHTTFSPGVGHGWFVSGSRVLQLEKGWTDVDKQTLLGDHLWPKPRITWHGDIIDEVENVQLPVAISSICMEDAWNGGSSLQLSFSDSGSGDSVLQSLWIPIQSLILSSGVKYTARAIYKVSEGVDVDRDIVLSIQGGGEATTTPSSSNDHLHEQGWSELSVELSVSESTTTTSLGLILTLIREDPSIPLALTLLLGQINVFPSDPPSSSYAPAIIWADYHKNTKLLEWGCATSLPRMAAINITSPDDPTPAWVIPESWNASFVYFNIYAIDIARASEGPKEAAFVGTSGYEDLYELFVGVERSKRFYVQGVTDRGEVVSWERCAYVDVEAIT